MIFVASGEGPSDVGSAKTGADSRGTPDFNPGPMTEVIDRLLEPILEYSALDIGALEFNSETALGAFCKSHKIGPVLPDLKREVGTGYFFKNARGLTRIARKKTTPGCPVGAILFRDSDGTRSTRGGIWDKKVDSIDAGFAAELFSFGVAMVPKPKSEAWLLCAAQNNPYGSCERFEEMSGNDASPNSLKDALLAALEDMGRTSDDILTLITEGVINPESLDLPSYNRFRDRLETVAREMLRSPAEEK